MVVTAAKRKIFHTEKDPENKGVVNPRPKGLKDMVGRKIQGEL
jgi:hypothetical protein